MFRSTKHAAMYQLTKFLKLHACAASDSNCTHISANNGSWIIPSEDLSEFLKLYSDAVQYFLLHIAEISPKDIKPIVADFFFHHMDKEITDYISPDTITSIVKKLELILVETFGNKHDFTCVVMVKKTGHADPRIFRFHFPYIVCNNIHHLILRNKFIETCDPYCDAKGKFDMEEVYLGCSSIQYLYLSTTHGIPQYKIYDGKIVTENTQEMVKLLSLRNKDHLLIQPIRGAEFYRYPLESKAKDECSPTIMYDVDIILKLLGMLKNFRSSDNDEILHISTILYYCHVTNANENADFYKIWKDWIERTYLDLLPIKIWQFCAEFSYYCLTIKNLYYYAHVGSPTLFEKTVDGDPTFKKYCY
uniref:C962R-like N-terminal AEP domain-containing protein n=1 Tax=viral metagenome TaxID=1070528 RepID=A0A6C0C5V5_9ZZZZ